MMGNSCSRWRRTCEHALQRQAVGGRSKESRRSCFILGLLASPGRGRPRARRRRPLGGEEQALVRRRHGRPTPVSHAPERALL
jgi:hypothetical protein